MFAGRCCAGLLWAPSTGPFGEASTRVCVRFRTFSAGYSLVVQSTRDSSGNTVDATWPFVLAFFPLVKSLEKLPQPLPPCQLDRGSEQNRTQTQLLWSPKLYCSLHSSPVNGEMSCGTEQQLYSESQQTETRVGQSPEECLGRLRLQDPFILKAEGVWLLVVNFLLWDSFVLAAAHVGQVTMFL